MSSLTLKLSCGSQAETDSARYQQLPKLEPSRLLGSSPHWRYANTTEPHTLQWCPMRDTSKRPKGAQKNIQMGQIVRSWDGKRASHEKARKIRRGKKKTRQDLMYRRQIKHDLHAIGSGWTLDINWHDS